MKKNKKLTRVKYQKELRKKKIRLRPWAFWTFLGVFSILTVSSLFILYNWDKDNKEIKKIEEEIEEVVTPLETTDEGELINPPKVKESDYWYYVKLPFYSVDFTELLSKNNDTVGYIHMENTNINYPVVQSTDNEYYLNHAYDKTKNDAGWVYVDYRNNKDFTDFNTIIYGHGRLNKTVFGSLKDSLTKKWQSNKDNYIISISTPNKNLNYQIFSIYTIQSETYYITPNFNNDSDKEKWINTMIERNIAPIDTTASINDHFITLSTCQNNDGGRIVVHAKLIKEQIR